MTTISTLGQFKAGNGISAQAYRVGAMLRRCGAAFLTALHEQRRREAARIIAHGRYLAALDHAARLGAETLPKVVPLRRSPATQPSQESDPV